MSADTYWSRVLLAYPSWYREQRGEELLGVLMESDARRSPRETVSLVGHGLRLRLRDPRRRGAWRPAQGTAGMVLAVVMGSYGVWLGSGAARAAVSARWYPDQAPYVDPLWTVGACWTAALVLLLLRAPRLATAAAWLGVAAHVALLLGAFGNESSLFYVDADGSWRTVALLQVAPTLALAVLLLRPAEVGEALERTGRRLPLLSAGCALVALGLVSLAGGDWQLVGIGGGLLALVVLHRQGVLLRGALAAFSGIAVVAVAQFVAYRPWFGEPVVGVTLVVAITGGLMLAVLVVGGQVESSTTLRRWAAARLDRLARALRVPDVP